MKKKKTTEQLLLINAVQKLKSNKANVGLTEEEFNAIYNQLKAACETHETSLQALAYISKTANEEQ